MFLADGWTDFELLDCAHFEKLERWGEYLLIRPDPQAVWQEEQHPALWKQAHARYHRSNRGGGQWEFLKKLPDSWTVSYSGMTFRLRPMGFKHTGLFPEQAPNWDFLMQKISSAGRPVSVLNLFAYTGGATVACAKAGAAVCHVDAAKGMVTAAKENCQLSGLADCPVRFIVDDAVKFVQREIRRGKRYDGIVMDPPSYGRGPGGEVWKIEDKLDMLMDLCGQVLSDRPLFFVLNSYTAGLSGTVMENLMRLKLVRRFGGRIASGELGIAVKNSDVILPCGNTARWEAEDGEK